MKHGFQERRRKLKRKLKELGASSLLVTNIKNVGYLTGFTGSAGYLFVSQHSEILMSDSRYASQLETECPDIEIDIRDVSSTILDSVERVAKKSKFQSIGFEAESLTKADYDRLESKLANWELVKTAGMVEELRAIKDDAEIAAIRKSIDINQQAFEVIRSQLTSDQTELEIAHNLEQEMRSLGATGCAFDPIVSVGARAALPHGQPDQTRISEGPIVLIDWGAKVDQYLSDLSRVLVTSEITSKFREIYQTVLQAQLAAINEIRPGVSLTTVDAAARNVIEAAGFGSNFGHGLGHGFGLEIHEQPFISPNREGTLEAGMIVTVEPGIYLPDFAGVRIEDDVLVTSEGHEVLSNLPKTIDECTVDLGG